MNESRVKSCLAKFYSGSYSRLQFLRAVSHSTGAHTAALQPADSDTKQPFRDRPGVLEDKAMAEATLSSAYHRAFFLAASTQHSGDWLFALPIASCGLKLDDEVVRVAGGLRLDLCEQHQCHCGSVVDAPIAVETLGVLNSSSNSLLKEIGNKTSLNTGESRGSVTYTSASRCLCSVSVSFCCTILCRPLTAPTEYRTRNCLAIRNF